MAPSARLLGLLLASLALLAAIPAASAGTTAAPYNLGDGNVFKAYLKTQAATSGPYLTQNQAASGPESYQAGDATSGAMLVPTSLQGGRSTPAEFKSDVSPGSDLWLDLSKSVVGALFWQSTASSKTSHEDQAVVVEFFQGDVRIGGDMFPYYPTTAYGDWAPLYFKFRPEVDHVVAGQGLIVKVSRQGGVADFFVGTGGAHQSYIEFRYFDANPLHGAFYVEGQKLVALGDTPPTPSRLEAAHRVAVGETSRETAHPGAARTGAVAVLPLVFLFILVPRTNRPTSAMVVLLLFLGPALAGCLAGSGAPQASGDASTEAPKPTANQTLQDDSTLAQEGHGAIEGFAYDGDNANLPVANAHVALIGTDLFTTTTKKGGFGFDNVTAGRFIMRVDASPFQTFEHSVEVENGKRTWVNITLYRGTVVGGATIAHVHDLWGDATSKVLLDKDVLPNSYLSQAPQSAGTWVQPAFAAAETPVAPPPSGLVLPGTRLVELVMSWSGTAMPTELGLRILTSGNKTFDQIFLARPPNVPFRIPIFPNEADGGHQDGTDWQFFVRMPGAGSAGNVWGPGVESGGTVHVRASIFKGIVPFEPSHRTFWNGADAITLFKAAKPSTTSICCAPPYVPGGQLWVPAKGLFVPPGTKQVTGTLKWSTQGSPVDQTWTLLYHSADQGSSDTSWKKATMKSTGMTSADFAVDVTPVMSDQFYQSASRWKFTMTNDLPEVLHPILVVNEAGETTFTLDATVVKDPAYNEAPAI